jgi:hypothetical protein
MLDERRIARRADGVYSKNDIAKSGLLPNGISTMGFAEMRT